MASPSWNEMLSFVIWFVAPVFSNASSSSFHGLVSSESWLPREPIIYSATGEELIKDVASLPMEWDWRNVNGQSFVTADVNQHIPQYCGSCWLHGTVAQINDRIKVARAGAFPDVMLSRQALMNCVEGDDGFIPGCFGGDSWMIYKHMHTHKVPDESCAPYRATNDKCEPETICRNCEPPSGFVAALTAGKSPLEILQMHMDMTAHCFAVPHYIGYGVTEYGAVVGESAMMKEIYARGPITCTMDANDDFMYRYAENVDQHEGVFMTDEKSNSTDHLVEVTGWGTTPSGVRYWVVRNSWGTYWGQAGWFKLKRGDNQLLIEGDCTWSVPDFGDATSAVQGKILGDYISGITVLPKPLLSGMASQPQNVGLSLPILATVATISACVGALVSSAFFLSSARRKQFQAPLLG